MRFFTKKAIPQFTAVKLYSLSEPSNREILISSILESLRETFGALPDEFDIHGPYGIKKGTTIGIQAFKNRLAKSGHNKYYALNGETSGKFGFHLLLGARINETSYSELIIWYAVDSYTIDFLKLVEPLLEPLNAVCGFDINIPTSHSIVSETEVKRGIFGGFSVKLNQNHLAWIPTIRDGALRGIFINNVVNQKQLACISPKVILTSQSVANGLHYFRISSEETRLQT